MVLGDWCYQVRMHKVSKDHVVRSKSPACPDGAYIEPCIYANKWVTQILDQYQECYIEQWVKYT